MEIVVGALTGALNSNTDALNRMATHSENQDEKLDKIMADMSDVRTRLTLIERTPLSSRLDKLETEVEVLKTERFQRIGMTKSADALLKYGPFVIALITAVFILLVATKRIVI